MDNNEAKLHNENISQSIHFMEALANRLGAFTRHLDIQNNVLVGVSGSIFLLLAANLLNSHAISIYLIVPMVFFGSAAIIGILAIHPPKLMRKKGQKESILYSRRISKFESPDAYGEEIKKLFKDDDILFNHYATEIYNLAKYYYRPKRKLFSIAMNIFIAGVVISGLFFIIIVLLNL